MNVTNHPSSIPCGGGQHSVNIAFRYVHYAHTFDCCRAEPCVKIWTSQPQLATPTVQFGGAMRRNSAYEDMVWTNDEGPGKGKALSESIKRAKTQAEREIRFCTSCNREKQSTAFDRMMKTCRACLEIRRAKRHRVSDPHRRKVYL